MSSGADVVYPRGRGIRVRAYPRGLLAPLSWLYALSSRGMASFASRKERPAQLRDTVIVSVGNISVGGNGKTPLAIHLLAVIGDTGMRCAYVSRGYGSHAGRAPGTTIVLPSHVTPDAGLPGVRFIARGAPGLAAEIGDEGELVARRAPGATLAFGRDKNAALDALGRLSPPDFVVLDDAFQSWTVPRDVDVVLVDGERPFESGRLLPAGALREAPRACGRADVVLANGVADNASLGTVRERVEARAGAVRRFGGLEREIDLIRRSGPDTAFPERVVAASAIARPERFEADLAATGADVRLCLRYPDHHRYTRRDAERIVAAVESGGHAGVVVTEKDWVKLEELLPESIAVWTARLDVRVVGVDLVDLIKTKKPQTSSAASRC